MNITTKGRYALRIMLDIAQQDTERYTSIKEIARRQGISVKYLEAIAATLNKAGLLESSRGKNGGYRLSKDPENYSIGSILKETSQSFVSLSQRAAGELQHGRPVRACRCGSFWTDGSANPGSVTLGDLLEGKLPPSSWKKTF